MSLSNDDIQHLARLARLYVSEEEAERLSRDLTEIVNFVDEAAAEDLSGVQPMIRPVEPVSEPRDDVAAPPAEGESAIHQAEGREDGWVRVPPVFGDQSSEEEDSPAT